MSTTRTILDFALIGALVGAGAASLAVPPWLAWYNAPGNVRTGGTVETLCDMPTLIRYATGHLIRAQMIGAVVGAVLFAAIGVLVIRGRGRRTTAPVPVD